MQHKLAAKEEALARSEASLAKATARCKELEQQLDDQVSRRAAAEQQQTDLLAQMKRMEADMELLRSEIAEKDRRIDTLEVRVESRSAATDLQRARKNSKQR